ncbi:hypothetical protein H4217_000330 [Coemansia sp. RSA 1939]|nr:hypothetical protein H4217_000330 [Coemansia sp. RSA 1939]KAJ2617642.1 hypothetical protein EV177_000467 [Coemansia sp. RSA 1804]KAJ2695460.1 hypothetical protein GGH99_000106 [Coemansia sp. RSA 1285]
MSTNGYTNIIDDVPTIEDIRDFEKIASRKKQVLIVYYVKTRPEEDICDLMTLERILELAVSRKILTVKWICEAYNGGTSMKKNSYLNTEYGIDDNMGVIMFRDRQYLTCIRSIDEEEEEKCELMEKVLDDYGNWPVRKTPKERAAAIKAKEAADAKRKKRRSRGCVIM